MSSSGPLVRPSRILFVCRANQTRSAFAEAAVKQLELAPSWLGGIEVRSRGIQAEKGRAAMPLAIEVAASLGVNLKGHLSFQIEPADTENAWVLGMTRNHLDPRWPSWRQGLLGEFVGVGEIADPSRMMRSTFEMVFQMMLECLREWSKTPEPAPSPATGAE